MPACACSLCPGRRHVTAPALAPAACPALPLPTPWVNTQSPARASWTSVIASKAGRGGRGGGRRKSGGTLPQARRPRQALWYLPFPLTGVVLGPLPLHPLPPTHNETKTKNTPPSERCGTAPAAGQLPRRPEGPRGLVSRARPRPPRGPRCVGSAPQLHWASPPVRGSFVSLVPVWLAQLVVHKCVLHSKASRAAAVKDDPRLSFHFRDVGAKPPPLHTRTAHAPSLTYYCASGGCLPYADFKAA